jgi:TRAP-type C4-dicarboxylate transport system permease small subunit
MKLITWLDEHLEEWILVVLLAAVCITLMIQIVMRYVFNASLSWSEEFARYCFVWSTFLSISYSIKKSSMLRVDILVQYLPKAARKAIDLLMELIVLAFFAFLLYHSFAVVKRIALSGQKSPALGLPMVTVYVALIVGFALACVRGVQKILSLIRPGTSVEAINTGRM